MSERIAGKAGAGKSILALQISWRPREPRCSAAAIVRVNCYESRSDGPPRR